VQLSFVITEIQEKRIDYQPMTDSVGDQYSDSTDGVQSIL